MENKGQELRGIRKEILGNETSKLNASNRFGMRFETHRKEANKIEIQEVGASTKYFTWFRDNWIN